jgi:GNAT superfamily N-acetyltransferase
MLQSPEPLSAAHVLDGFDSGIASLDDWLRKRALANQASGASRTFVACDAGRVVAYYALAASAIATESAPGELRRNTPDPVPVVVLGRLAIARSHQGQGLGRSMFQDAAHRIVQTADTIGIRGMLVHAISEEAKAFYLQLGLNPSPLEPMMLMLTIADLRAALGE